jgi:glycosyltransferase involved in cell wall biosynthesis
MPDFPRISVVTPSFNQGEFIARTIDSVLAQDYPNLEHIVVDGMSTDDTPAILARYPHLRVLREPDGGQSEAINKGFRLATGDIFCFLNSDDTYLPGTLDRVAREIDPVRSRHIVTGRCIYIDEHDAPTGVEHPCGFEGRRRLLQAWKVNYIPQPSTFWTAEAWRRCGPLDETEHLVLDYDLMCRFSRRYRFHILDQVLATYRLHARSKTCLHREQEVFVQATRVSRRYWGSPLCPLYWQLRWSLLSHRLEQKLGRLRGAARLRARSHEALGRGQLLRAVYYRLRADLLAPEVALRQCVRLCLRPLLPRTRPGAITEGWSAGLSAQTLAWRDFTGVHADRCVGPSFVTTFRVAPGHRSLLLDGAPVIDGLPRPLDISLSIDGRLVHRHHLPKQRSFTIAVPVTELSPGEHQLSVLSGPFIVPRDHLGSEDDRPLCFRLKRFAVTPDGAGNSGSRARAA